VRTPSLVLVLCAAIGLAQGQPESHPPTLTHVVQVHRLTEEQANQKYPVHVRVVVTYATDLDMFVQDSTDGIWVARPKEIPLLKPGIGLGD